jgi:endonuclease-3
MDDRSRFAAVLDRLGLEYPETPSLLNFSSPFELLVGVILSAQTTDEAVNETLPRLFGRYPDALSLAGAQSADVEEIIHSLGFFRQKTKSIIGTSRALVNRFDGAVPSTMEDLITLPGVGRKSAGVILLHVFDRPAIIVDTHFGRVTRRLGFTAAKDPARVERDVAGRLPEELWNAASMRLNYHGRRFCFARKPACDTCPVRDLCPRVGVA